MKRAASGRVAVAASWIALTPFPPPAVAAEQDGRFAAGTTAVTVDVVVRDRRGNPVTDLKLEDFELLEGGDRQRIADVALVAPPALGNRASARSRLRMPEASLSRPKDDTSPSSRPETPPTFVALVFDRLSPEARALSYRGALAYLDTSVPDDYAGVFLSDLSLVTVQTFTNDRARLKQAIDDVASRATSRADRFRISSRAFGDDNPGTGPAAGPESEGPATAATDPLRIATAEVGGRGDAAAGLAVMAARMERAFEAMSRDQEGHATTNSLLAIIQALGELPGRKTLVLFADALAIPPHVQSRFESVVAAANRANVSVYSVDAAGLRVQSGQAETARRMNALGAGAVEREGEVGGKLLESLERNEDALRRDPSVSLRVLAEWTGGFLVSDTNDLAAAFREIDSDRRFHYLLTYTPSNQAFTGEWRPIAVRVRRAGVNVRARAGYLAVRTPGTIPLLVHEAPALAVLEHQPLPRGVPARAAVYQFPESPTPRVAVLVEVPANALTHEVDAAAGRYRNDFSVLARFVDASGRVVRKASEPYRLGGAVADLEHAQRGRVLFYRQPTLDPGDYTFEYVVHDALGRKAGAGRRHVRIDPVSSPAVSSLVIVERAERVPAAERDPANPLYYGDLLLYPSIDGSFRRGIADHLPVYWMLHVNEASTAALTVSQDDRVVADVPLNLPPPDGIGRIQGLSRVPLAALAPGRYELTLTVTSGTRTVSRTTEAEVFP